MPAYISYDLVIIGTWNRLSPRVHRFHEKIPVELSFPMIALSGLTRGFPPDFLEARSARIFLTIGVFKCLYFLDFLLLFLLVLIFSFTFPLSPDLNLGDPVHLVVVLVD